MKIPFVGGAYAGKSSDVNAQKTTNLMPVLDKQGGKEVVALYPTPGLSPGGGYNMNATGCFRTTGGDPVSPSGSDFLMVRE